MIIKYNKKTYQILGFYIGNINDIKLSENEGIKELDIEDCGQTDIRAYKEDGSCKTIEEQIEEKIIVLKDNEIVRDGIVVELNKNYEEDYIELLKRGIEKLDDNQKMEYDKINNKYRIVEKDRDEKYINGLIGDAEYNEQIISTRRGMYNSQIDPLLMELVQEYFNGIELPEKLKEKFNEIINKKQAIKEEFPKTTSDNFKEVLKEKLNVDINNLDNLDNLISKSENIKEENKDNSKLI